MVSNSKKQIPVKEGLWRTPPDEEPYLIGSKCPSCGEIVFPKMQVCLNCQEQNVEEVKLSRRGKIYTVTVVMQQPPLYYKGPVPYALGYVELPEGVRLETLYTDCGPDSLEIGMDVELVVEKLYDDDEGNELITYKFRPIKE